MFVTSRLCTGYWLCRQGTERIERRETGRSVLESHYFGCILPRSLKDVNFPPQEPNPASRNPWALLVGGGGRPHESAEEVSRPSTFAGFSAPSKAPSPPRPVKIHQKTFHPISVALAHTALGSRIA